MSANEDEVAAAFQEALEEERRANQAEEVVDDVAQTLDEAAGQTDEAVGQATSDAAAAAGEAVDTATETVDTATDAAADVTGTADGSASSSGGGQQRSSADGSGSASGSGQQAASRNSSSGGSPSSGEGSQPTAGEVARDIERTVQQVERTAGAAGEVASDAASDALAVTASGASAGPLTNAQARTRRGVRRAAAAVESDPTFRPIRSEAQAQQRRGTRGAVEAVKSSFGKGGAERQASVRTTQEQRDTAQRQEGIRGAAQGLVEGVTGVGVPTEEALVRDIRGAIASTVGIRPPNRPNLSAGARDTVSETTSVTPPTQRELQNVLRTRAADTTGVAVPTEQRLVSRSRAAVSNVTGISPPTEREFRTGTTEQLANLNAGTLGAAAPVAAVEPTLAGEAVLGAAAGLGGVAAASTLTSDRSELPAEDRFGEPELPATEGRPQSELPVGQDGGVQRTEVQVGDSATSTTELGLGELFGNPEIPLRTPRSGTGDADTGADETVVPDEFPLAGRDTPADPDREFTGERSPEAILDATPLLGGLLEEEAEQEDDEQFISEEIAGTRPENVSTPGDNAPPGNPMLPRPSESTARGASGQGVGGQARSGSRSAGRRLRERVQEGALGDAEDSTEFVGERSIDFGEESEPEVSVDTELDTGSRTTTATRTAVSSTAASASSVRSRLLPGVREDARQRLAAAQSPSVRERSRDRTRPSTETATRPRVTPRQDTPLRVDIGTIPGFTFPVSLASLGSFSRPSQSLTQTQDYPTPAVEELVNSPENAFGRGVRESRGGRARRGSFGSDPQAEDGILGGQAPATPDAADGELLPGFLAETYTDIALLQSQQSASTATEAELEAAAEAGAFEGELPTAELLNPTAEQAAAFEAIAPAFGLEGFR